MYAIIADGGNQYRVEEGQEVQIDFREAAAGDEMQFDRVLAVSSEEGVRIGKPTVAGASVSAAVLGLRQGPKLTVQKIRRRKNARRRTGHRQMHTAIRITKIEVRS